MGVLKSFLSGWSIDGAGKSSGWSSGDTAAVRG